MHLRASVKCQVQSYIHLLGEAAVNQLLSRQAEDLNWRTQETGYADIKRWCGDAVGPL